MLVRWLVEDDAKQTARVGVVFKAAIANGIVLFVPATVMLELEWVLRSRYRYGRAAVLQTFNALLEAQELEFENEAALERALHLYRQGAAEFADCLQAGLCGAAEKLPLLSFDEAAARLPDVELLKA